ncbi:MAG: FeoC-like transcriptional regulator [Legionellaceae bacterium]|nr:FeoC-like transcriptional regulator [Legionellaceae bacterium]
MSREFRVTKDALIPMLDIWVAKGVIRQSQKVACGRKCFSCKPRRPEFYQWI